MSLRFPNVFANRPTDDFCFATLRSSSPLDRRWLRESQLANDFRMLQRVEITGWYSVHSFFEHRTHYSFGIGELRVRRYRAGLLVTGLVGFFIRYSYLRITIEREGKKVYQFRFFHAPLYVLFYVLPRISGFPRSRSILVNPRFHEITQLSNIRRGELFDDAPSKYSYLVPFYLLFFLSRDTRVHAKCISEALSKVNLKNLVRFVRSEITSARKCALYLRNESPYRRYPVKSNKVRSSKLLTVGRNFLLVY